MSITPKIIQCIVAGRAHHPLPPQQLIQHSRSGSAKSAAAAAAVLLALIRMRLARACGHHSASGRRPSMSRLPVPLQRCDGAPLDEWIGRTNIGAHQSTAHRWEFLGTGTEMDITVQGNAQARAHKAIYIYVLLLCIIASHCSREDAHTQTRTHTQSNEYAHARTLTHTQYRTRKSGEPCDDAAT